MATSPWLAITHSEGFSELRRYPQAWDRLNLVPSAIPVLILMEGRRTKSEVLGPWVQPLSKAHLLDHHGQVVLRSDWATRKTAQPLIFVDFELQNYDIAQWRKPCGSGPELTTTICPPKDLSPPFARRRLCNLLGGRAIGPLCAAICLFTSDLGGMRATAALVAEQAAEKTPSDLPPTCRPALLIVVDTVSKSYSSSAAEVNFSKTVSQILHDQYSFSEEMVMEKLFSGTRVVSLRRDSSPRDRSYTVRAALQDLTNQTVLARRTSGTLFHRDHTVAFSERLLEQYASPPMETFSFAGCSRAEGLNVEDLSYHFQQLVDILPSEIWLWHLGVPLLSSAIIFSCYPPGSHGFSIEWLYDRLFARKVQLVIGHSITQVASRDSFLWSLRRSLTADYSDLVKLVYGGAVPQHRARLRSLKNYLSNVRSHKTCLCCLLRSPEKLLPCGHAVCDTCVKAFGCRLLEDRFTYEIQDCPFCGETHTQHSYSFLPPTAGIRLLSMDGGGVKGVILLTFLEHLDSILSRYQLPLRDYFDFVCGTSAGGLVAIGLFIMQWPITECFKRFTALAKKTFGTKQGSYMLTRLHNLTISYLKDYRYSSTAIEESFRSTFGDDISMFNPLNNDTKIAVTTTTARESQPCIFTNYNGKRRDQDIGYELVRAQDSKDDILVSEAASCTSAAPWFFKARNIRMLGTFQDGGLQHNNPLKLALSEVKQVWPSASLPDFVLSLGTGLATNKYRIGPQSPVRDRFLRRIFRTFMRSMDGEKVWQEVFQGLPECVKHRYHRLNVVLPDQEPSLDDVTSMHILQQAASMHITKSSSVQDVVDSILASTFYFEFDEMPTWEDGAFCCKGNIFCRLRLSMNGRRMLYEELSATSSHFLIFGTPVFCVERMTMSVPSYKRSVTFTLPDLDSEIAITLRGITSKPCTISGLPRTANDVIKAQGLQAPFGNSDHRPLEKPLPPIPKKRKLAVACL